ncbi:uncharacterized protein METZ01_LOCUS478232 [marine metagenome]|uniref:Uncharacterized protein n=1 Tax=marine metagenome TaxID=408172 RepID=A0A383C182_9ZZZZ
MTLSHVGNRLSVLIDGRLHYFINRPTYHHDSRGNRKSRNTLYSFGVSGDYQITNING